MYKKELEAIQNSNRFRKRTLFDENLLDFASNDYLGFAEDKTLLSKAIKELRDSKSHSPKASLLVNGYSKYHLEFEKNLANINGFESAISVGSGFLANISMIEALVRKKDVLFIDEEYHASGILATRLTLGEVIKFKHNDVIELEALLQKYIDKKNRIFIAIEGVYSMSGDLAKKEIFDLSEKYNAMLIVDEAHSSGVIGDKLLGIFDLYSISPTKNHVKMGTLGKAYGSYGAYILASDEVISFLENRAKPIIYSTALSIFDVALANQSLLKIQKNSSKLKSKIDARIKLTKDILGLDIDSLILKIEVKQDVISLQRELLDRGFIVGAIRPPTVSKAILRVILRISNPINKTKLLLKLIRDFG